MRILNCSNPNCNNLIPVTAEQKHTLLTANFLKYGKLSLVYCSKACQEEHQADLSRSRFFVEGTLKNYTSAQNHTSALVRKGEDVSKRKKRSAALRHDPRKINS